MKKIIEINSLVKIQPVERRYLEAVSKLFLRQLKIKKQVSLVLLGDKKVRKLNRIYRNKNRVTDVLAFGDFSVPGGDKNFLGEIVICLPQARRQARKHKVSFKEEAARLLIHGLLHLKGYDHEKGGKEAKKMFDLQERILKHVTCYMLHVTCYM